MTPPIPDPAGILPTKPDKPYEFWLDYVIDYAFESMRAKFGERAAHRAAEAHTRAELQALRGRVAELGAALRPIVAIADAYDANDLDDEARKRWGTREEYESTRPYDEIVLYAGRGGRELLTLADCLAARQALNGGSR